MKHTLYLNDFLIAVITTNMTHTFDSVTESRYQELEGGHYRNLSEQEKEEMLNLGKTVSSPSINIYNVQLVNSGPVNLSHLNQNISLSSQEWFELNQEIDKLKKSVKVEDAITLAAHYADRYLGF